jgi:hypothetical protein
MGRNTPNPDRTSEVAADQKLIDGLTKHAATLPPFLIAGASTTTTEVIAKLQARIAAANAVAPARGTWQAAVEAARSQVASTKSLVGAVKQALLLAFAGQADVLADFGLSPRKPRVVTPETKIAAAAKAKATRAARHTAGPVQKKAITGNVTGVVVTPVVTVTSAPAPAAPPPGGAPSK